MCHNIRIWPEADGYDVAVHCQAAPDLPIAEAHTLAEQLEKQIITQLPNVHQVLVHMEPGGEEDVDVVPDGEGLVNWKILFSQLRGIADGFGLGLHDLHIHDPPDAGYTVEVHLEFPTKVTLGEAHTLADQFEEEVKHRWPQAEHVVTHLEPLPEDVLRTEGDIDSTHEELIRFLLKQHLKAGQLRDLRVFFSGEHLHTAITIGLPPSLPLTEVHTFTEQIETDLLKQVPALARVTLHVEPEG
jgi:divalent metal cation (Fe/Co/Zn/Cd) transporter